MIMSAFDEAANFAKLSMRSTSIRKVIDNGAPDRSQRWSRGRNDLSLGGSKGSGRADRGGEGAPRNTWSSHELAKLVSTYQASQLAGLR